MNRQALDELKQQIPLMGYLQAHDWSPARPLSGGRWMGLCPLHEDHKPSFLVDTNKDLFYCYGCGRGGDVIRFAELYHQVKFPQALALLRQWRGAEPLLHEAARFYRIQLHRHSEAVAYLYQRGIRSQATDRAHADRLRARRLSAGLADAVGSLFAGSASGRPGDRRGLRRIRAADRLSAGRQSLWPQPFGLRRRRTGFLPGAKGGLYAWEQVRSYPEVILVEGLFDYAVLWEAGFHNVTCSLGTHLNARQFRQLCDGPRTVYIAFDADGNGSGQQAAQCLSRSLRDRCLGSARAVPYSADRGKKSVSRQALDELKQQIPLLDYLQTHDWQPARRLSRGRLMGLCPLHADHKPSFLVDPGKRPVLLLRLRARRRRDSLRRTLSPGEVPTSAVAAPTMAWVGAAASGSRRFLPHAVTPPRRGSRLPQSARNPLAGTDRGNADRLRARWLSAGLADAVGLPSPGQRQAGLVTGAGYDAYIHRIVFPLEGNLYGRSLSAAAPPHRFLPGAKGGLYAWDQVRRYPEVILVEGLFDYAALRQAGFHNVTCSMGTHLNARQFRQLCDGPRTVYLAFDADQNGSGQQAAQSLAMPAHRARHTLRALVSLPEGHDPNSFFVQGGDARQFQSLLEAAQ